jgi:hypothetical protein
MLNILVFVMIREYLVGCALWENPEDGCGPSLQNVLNPTRLHGSTSQKTTNYIFTAVRTSNDCSTKRVDEVLSDNQN